MKTINDDIDFEGIPARLLGPIQLWKEGHDLKSIYPRRTWYRYRKDILSHINLDISLKAPMDIEKNTNVIPLIQVLEAKPMDIPHWAEGTDLYFVPPVYNIA